MRCFAALVDQLYGNVFLCFLNVIVSDEASTPLMPVRVGVTLHNNIHHLCAATKKSRSALCEPSNKTMQDANNPMISLFKIALVT